MEQPNQMKLQLVWDNNIMTDKKIDKSVIITSVIALAAMQIAAMYFGINGTFRTIIVGTICAIVGVTIPLDKIIKK